MLNPTTTLLDCVLKHYQATLASSIEKATAFLFNFYIILLIWNFY